MNTNFTMSFVRRSIVLLGALMTAAVFSADAGALQDAMLQTMAGKIVTGIVNDQTGAGTLGTRVYGGQFSLVNGTFRASNPGFYGLRTGDPLIPSGAAGFPANHDVNFDLLPMSIEEVSSNLFYWDGSDANGGGVDLSDVNFVVPQGIYWEQRDDNFIPYTVYGTDELVTGGLIDRSSADVWPDGIDSGSIHAHLAMLVNDSDGNSSTPPPAGIYMISWQARSVGFATSDPFFFVLRSPTITDPIRDIAVDWVEQHLNVPGDYNGDGTVNAADYVVWRKGGPLANEVDTPGTVNQADYTEWRVRFGNTGIAVGGGLAGGGRVESAVPEPATFAILWIAAISLSSQRLGRKMLSNSLVVRTAEDYTR
jgi:hypothetical protein